MLFSQALTPTGLRGRALNEQWAEVQNSRNAFRANEESFQHVLNAQGLHVNDGLVPQDVYQEFDNVTVERFRSDDGDAFLNDLLPLSVSVSIGRLVRKFRRASDAGNAQTSMSGQIGVKMDQTQFSYDGTIIPIIDTGFGRNWREWNAQRAEGFDALIDDQRESVAALRAQICDNFLDGNKDKNGQTIVLDGLSWTGMRNDSRVAQVNIGAAGVNFDFTDTTKTYALIEAAFKQVINTIWLTNNYGMDLEIYVSREIASNIERQSSESYNSATIITRLAQLSGVAGIKSSSKLSGNEFFGIPLNGDVRPVSGMGINTVAMPRPVYNSNYNFAVWGAVGWEVKTDFSSRKCSFMAAEA
ncbi:MAG: phage coat protein [Candidatus Sabulitectum sp.]|nr:phage coat protein [Candidatus Sabulitectum sp.]